MSVNVKLSISNINNSDYKTVILRKFFNMVFISRDGRTLKLYTATMFEGSKHKKTDKQEIPEPSYNGDDVCKVKFKYEVEGDSVAIKYENLTDSLFKQTSCLEKVWGSCKKIDTQNLMKQELESLYPNTYSAGKGGQVPSISPEHLKFEEEGKGDHFICIAGKGKYEDNGEEYTLCADKFPGISAMNWVRTTIVLSRSVLTEKLNFQICFPDDSDFCTPDFTFYFAPPINYSVDEEITTVKIGSDKDVKNIVTRVADNTTVDFNEWVEDENINELKKSRVGFSSYLSSDIFYLSKKHINIFVSFSNPVKHGNSQFFLGLIFAFVLGFCSDKTLLNDYHTCLSAFCKCKECFCKSFCNSIGIVAPILVILTFLTIIYRSKNCLPVKPRCMHVILKLTKIIGIVTTTLFLMYTFVFWNIFPNIMTMIVDSSCSKNMIVSVVLFVLSLIFNLVYIIYCWGIRRKKFFDYL